MELLNLDKEFIPYEQALALKKLGFDEPCFGRYYYKESYPMLNPNSEKTELVFEFGRYIKQTEVTILVPLYQQAFRWFREKYNLFQYIQPSFDCTKLGYQNYSWLIKLRERVFIKNGTFKTYEEAEFECLKKLIEIVNEKHPYNINK